MIFSPSYSDLAAFGLLRFFFVSAMSERRTRKFTIGLAGACESGGGCVEAYDLLLARRRPTSLYPC